MPQPSVPEICLKITCLRFHSCLPGANELTFQVLVLCVNGSKWHRNLATMMTTKFLWNLAPLKVSNPITSWLCCQHDYEIYFSYWFTVKSFLHYIMFHFYAFNTPHYIFISNQGCIVLDLILEWFISLFVISHCTFHLLRNLQCLADGEFAEFGILPSAFCCCIYKGLKPLYVYFHHWRHLNFISVISRAFLKLYTLFLSKMLCKMQILPSMTLLDMIFIMWNNNIYKVSAFLQWVWISITVKSLI